MYVGKYSILVLGKAENPGVRLCGADFYRIASPSDPHIVSALLTRFQKRICDRFGTPDADVPQKRQRFERYNDKRPPPWTVTRAFSFESCFSKDISSCVIGVRRPTSLKGGSP